jgi:acetyl-CoA acetyltransferase family protein
MSSNGHGERVVICGGARTPVGVKCGTLGNFAAEDLAVLACNEAIRRAGVDRERIDTAIGANVYQFTAPGAQDIYFPRNVALRCGLREDVPALMVQRICGSGLQTIIAAMQQIALPDAIDDTAAALCFGAETMSRCPRIDRSPRRSAAHFWEFIEHHPGGRHAHGGNGRRNGVLEDSMLASLNHDLARTAMMLTADEYGSRMGITRRDCDEFAAVSHERARGARSASHLNGGDALGGMFALDARDLCGRPVHMARDECVREPSLDTLASLPGLTPNGLVSPGNASEIADGAAALVIASAKRAGELGISGQFEVAGYGVAGVDPRVMGRGPVPAVRQALRRAGIEQDEVDLWEINEAFAAQYLGVEKELGLPRDRVNVNGGAIAIGHPLAATGARIVVDLMYELDRRGARHGVASACIGGGQGVAIVIRNTHAKRSRP